MCQTCQGAGCDAYGYNCGDCSGNGVIIVDLAPKEEPKAEPEEYVRKVIVPQADQYDFIAKRMKELEAERMEAINAPDPDLTPTPAAVSTQTDEDFYAWGY